MILPRTVCNLAPRNQLQRQNTRSSAIRPLISPALRTAPIARILGNLFQIRKQSAAQHAFLYMWMVCNVLNGAHQVRQLSLESLAAHLAVLFPSHPLSHRAPASALICCRGDSISSKSVSRSYSISGVTEPDEETPPAPSKPQHSIFDYAVQQKGQPAYADRVQREC